MASGLTMPQGNVGALARFKEETVEGVEHLHHYWVVGPEGAVSMWFSDTRKIIGKATCTGAAWHCPRPFDGGEHHGPCEFIESECWCDTGSYLGHNHLREAFARDDDEHIYGWLAQQYEEAPWRR